jgi:hypothetical protein
MIRSVALAEIAWLLASCAQAAPQPGYTANVAVANPTRIDWTFAASNRSVVKPTAEFLDANYDSTKQKYELFLPPTWKDALKKPLPAILFISAGDEPSGWKSYEGPCTQLGFVFIGVRGAGNSVPVPKRMRIVLDAFDDVRQQLPLDPDRTYISGVSGGGRIACGIGFALPEYFGGLLPFVASGDLRNEPWLRHRAIDRLSAALVTGQTDFNRGEVEKWRGPMWKEIGIRTRVWVVPNMGHTNPPSATILEAIKWLEEGKVKRAALAKKYPATRASTTGTPSRAKAAKALFDEGNEKLKSTASQFAGLMLLKGTMERWPDLEVADAAKKTLLEFEDKKAKPWEADDVAEQRRYLVAEARWLSNYVLNGIPPKSQYAKYRPDFAKGAIERWEKVIADAPDSAAGKEGKKQVPELEKLVK